MEAKAIILAVPIIIISVIITINGQPPPPCTITNPDLCCDTSGLDGNYSEGIVPANDSYLGFRREIYASGCPNHPSIIIAPNPNVPAKSFRDRFVPAYPCFSDRSPYNLSCSGGAVGWTFGGGVSIFSLWAGPSVPCDDNNDAVVLEGDTYDNCSGHATPFGSYHYHLAPACLLNQLGDFPSNEVCKHSPQIGWAVDGFPIYGPHGDNGNEIYGCDNPNADLNDCLDQCGGHDQHEIDGFKYHYHIQGPIGDLASSPLYPLPGIDRRPYSLGCLRGVPYDWRFVGGSNGGNGAVCAEGGTTEDYIPTVMEGLPLYTGEPIDDDSSDSSDDSSRESRDYSSSKSRGDSSSKSRDDRSSDSSDDGSNDSSSSGGGD